jgi:hypothetical protein
MENWSRPIVPKFAALRLFVKTMHIYKAVATGNRNNELYRETAGSNWKKTLDRHSAIQKLNYCLLPDPPNFSLPSTFKLRRHLLHSFLKPAFMYTQKQAVCLGIP